jgi:hypothetical protein
MTDIEKLACKYVDEKPDSHGFYDAFIVGYDLASSDKAKQIKEFASWLQGEMWDNPDKDFEELADDFLKDL